MKKLIGFIALLLISASGFGQANCTQIKKGWGLKCGPVSVTMIDTALVRIWVNTFAGGGGGTGTVTNFSAGDLAPLFTTTEATTTTTPALSFNLSNAASFTAFCRGTGIGAPSFQPIDTSWIGNFYLKTRATIFTGTNLQYLAGNGSLITFPTNVSSFSNDVGYWLSSASVADGGSDITFAGTLASLGGFINALAVSDAMINDVGWSKITSIPDAASDGITKGVATFWGSDFNDVGGLIALDYTTGVSASAGAKGYLTSADWTTFNNKYSGLPSQTGHGGKYLTTNGTTESWATVGGGGDALVANPLSQFAATTSTQLRGVISDELGTGAALFDGATPTGLVLTNATGLPIAGGGTGATTAATAKDNLGIVSTIMLIHANSTYDASATRYFGAYPVATISSTANNNYITIPYNCTIIGASISIRGGGSLSTSGTATISININNGASNVSLAACTIQAVQQTFTVTGLSQAISAGQTIEGKIVNTAWGTNTPTNVQTRVDLFVR